ncbi:hypothetical protein [Streptomyces sp. NBC_01803]|uniref:hypothetical protein n=1 Tax=Streptomyces sp. NBC_01803 TaxID=2975946 RepID=UPI002DDC7AD4|nr:hypothetical protein [Streptomyces sp. NBC_01803]WSA44387.1 hypothetical protein OIE51_09330 [Streptomyces sp. NBC_01803]
MKLAIPTGVLTATALTAGFTAGCDLQQAVDCARLALEVTSSAEALGQAVEANDPQAFADAADTLTGDVSDVQNDVDDADVSAAADSIQAALDSIQAGFEDGTVVDLSPLYDATGQLTDACSS